jgi:hypothetical protein
MKRLVLSLSVGLATILPCLLLPGTASASAPYNYLRVGSSEIVFVQFAVTDQNVVGVLHDDVLNVSPADQSNFTPAVFSISSNVYNFTGTDDSGHLTLFINGNSTATFGTVSGGSLSLQLTQSDGSVATLTLGGSSLTAYNNALARWQNQLNNENNAAANTEAKAQQAAENQQQLLNNLNAAITTVDNDLSTMQNPGTLSDDLGVVDNDLAVVNNDLNVVHNDNAVLTNDISTGTDHSGLCGDVSTEYQDAGVVVSDTKVMVNDAETSLDSDLGQDQQAMDNAPMDWATYWEAQHALPTEVPTTPIPPLKVAVAEGQSTINQAIGHVNADIRQANSYIAQAYAMPNAAQKAMSCGATKKVPVIQTLRWT